MRRLAVTLRILMASLLLAAPAVFACECGPGSEKERELATVDAVFEATVESITEDRQTDDLVKVKVGRRWKGVPAGELVLRTKTGKSCGYHFKEQTTYLVFAIKTPEGLRVTTCGATKPMAEADATLARLPAPMK